MLINVVLALMIVASFLVAIPLHEFGHALMALWLGDRTALNEGRMSLSPRAHLDPLGTLMCVILAFQPGLAALVKNVSRRVREHDADSWRYGVRILEHDDDAVAVSCHTRD